MTWMFNNDKTYFFGWTSIKWFIREWLKMYSGEPSWFSKKRAESGFAFVVAEWGMIFFLYMEYQKMSMSDMVMWSGVQLGIAGYTVSQIQKEKKDDKVNPPADNPVI